MWDFIWHALALVGPSGAFLTVAGVRAYQRKNHTPRTSRRRIRNPELRRAALQMRAVAVRQRNDPSIKEQTTWKADRRRRDHVEWRHDWERLDPIENWRLAPVYGRNPYTNKDARAAWDRRVEQETERVAEEVLRSRMAEVLRHRQLVQRKAVHAVQAAAREPGPGRGLITVDTGEGETVVLNANGHVVAVFPSSGTGVSAP